ncbi:hypothetical protein ACHQM5_000689 [Ranunculus cassubicifolius]
MEETTKSAPSPTIPPQPQDLPNPTIQNLPKSQSRPSSHSKKRKAENVNSYNDNYIKLCNIIKDLRPHFIEVLRTPDFCNSKAADEIRKKMKHVMDVSKQVQVETTSYKISNKPPESEPLSNEIKDTRGMDSTHPEDKQVKPMLSEAKQGVLRYTGKTSPQHAATSEAIKKEPAVPQSTEALNCKNLTSARRSVPRRRSRQHRVKPHSPSPELAPEKLVEDEVIMIPGSYTVGGSKPGWNYIMYRAEKAVYYGVTKESHRAQK